MPGPLFSVQFNYPRTEMLQAGWRKSRIASSFTYLAWDTSTGTDQFFKSTLPDNLWREPNTGVIMLRPSTLMRQFWEDDTLKTELEDAMLDASKWILGDDGLSGVTGMLAYPFTMHTRREQRGYPLIELLNDTARMAILLVLQSELVWCMKSSESLFVNEGWSVWVHPPGVFTDRAIDFMLINFGRDRCLHLRMNGTASMWANMGTQDEPRWIETVTFPISGGGLDPNKPYQITCVPFGYTYISLVFSQVNDTKQGARNTVSAEKSSSFLYDIAKYELGAAAYESTTRQWIKTKAAPIHVALRRYLWQYGFTWARVRYPYDETFYVAPERLPQAINVTPVVQPEGFDGQRLDGLSVGTQVSTNFGNYPDGAVWDPATHTQLVVRHTLTPDDGLVYTPEVWGHKVDIPGITWTPTWTPIDVSDRWTLLRFQLSTDWETTRGQFKLEEGLRNGTHDGLYDGILKVGGPVHVEYDGDTVFDGYITEKQPTIGGPLAIQTTQYNAKDVWMRLEERKILQWKFLDGESILDTITLLLMECGWEQTDVVNDDATGYIEALVFGGFNESEDRKNIAENTTAAEVIRECLKWYSIVPIRLRYVDAKWHLSLAPNYDPLTPPTVTFLATNDNTGWSAGDVDRWGDEAYLFFTNLEFTSAKLNFNGLVCRTTTTSNDGAKGMQSIVPADMADPDSLTDDTSVWFVGREILEIKEPPEIALAQDSLELQKICRAYWERHRRDRPSLEGNAEWNYSLQPDTFVTLIGKNPDGDMVSYGAWRIEFIDVEATRDYVGKDNRTFVNGNYTLVFVGKSEPTIDGNVVPMFTADANLPL